MQYVNTWEELNAIVCSEEAIRTGMEFMIKLTASWCHYCPQAHDLMVSLMSSSTRKPPTILVVDVDKAPKLAHDLDVTGMPTYICVRNMQRVVGFHPGKIRAFYAENFAPELMETTPTPMLTPILTPTLTPTPPDAQ